MHIFHLAEEVTIVAEELDLDVGPKLLVTNVLGSFRSDLGDMMIRRLIQLINHTCVIQRIAGSTSLFLFELTKFAQNSSGIVANFHWLKLLDIEVLGVSIFWVLLSACNLTIEQPKLLGPDEFVILHRITRKDEGVQNGCHAWLKVSTALSSAKHP